MSFSDPLSLTYPAPITLTPSLPRVSVGQNVSEYKSSDGFHALTASHQYGRRNRRLLKLDYTKIGADVFLPDTNVEKSMSVYLVVDTPKVGFTNAEMVAVYTALKTAMTASSDLLVTKLIGGES